MRWPWQRKEIDLYIGKVKGRYYIHDIPYPDKQSWLAHLSVFYKDTKGKIRLYVSDDKKEITLDDIGNVKRILKSKGHVVDYSPSLEEMIERREIKSGEVEIRGKK